MQIRKLQTNDFKNWQQLWHAYQAFYQTELGDEVTQTTFQRFLDSNEPMFCLVVEHETALVGFVHYIFHRSTWSLGNYCYLQDLYVDETTRGQKLGRKLIEAVYKAAADTNCSRVYWLTHESNQAARYLYDQVAVNAGFIQYRKNLNM